VRTQQYDPAETNIVCPWHGYEYNIKTGCHQGNDRIRLRKAEMTIRDGEIYVRV
jgi:nitrite reductase (NADH) small subunit